MPEPAPFQQGEALQWVTIENGFNSRRMVTYEKSSSDHAAIVRFGTERMTVAVRTAKATGIFGAVVQDANTTQTAIAGPA